MTSSIIAHRHPRIRTLDGIVREWDEVFAPGIHMHSMDQLVGYVVRRTFFDRDVPHEDVQRFDGADGFGAAVELAHAIRLEQGRVGYAVVDRVYSDGIRSNG